jgi:hypothetical protein
VGTRLTWRKLKRRCSSPSNTWYAVVTLLLHCCHTAVTLLLHHAAVTLLLHHAVVTLLLHCCNTVVTLSSMWRESRRRCSSPSNTWYTVVTLLSHCCYTVVASRCCYIVVASRCCYVVITLLKNCCYAVVDVERVKEKMQQSLEHLVHCGVSTSLTITMLTPH